MGGIDIPLAQSEDGSRLAGRVALVSGASSQIGCGIAHRLADAGAAIMLVDYPDRPIAELQKQIELHGGRASAIACELADRTGAERICANVVRNYGRIDILVAAAEYRTAWLPLTELSDPLVEQSLRAFRETLWWMQAVYPIMCARGGGSIIALGSTYGHYAQRYIAGYKATKEAVKGLVLSAAHEWAPYGIRVNTLECAADTAEFQLHKSKHASAVDSAIAGIPMRRMGNPIRDVGGAALFLASDDSRYVTGEVIRADGGEHLSVPAFEPLPVGFSA